MVFIFVLGFGTKIALFGRIVALLLAILEHLMRDSVCSEDPPLRLSLVAHLCAGGLSHGKYLHTVVSIVACLTAILVHGNFAILG